MKKFVLVLLSLVAFTAHANETCLSQDEAREVLLNQDRTILSELKQQYNVGLCKGRPNQGCITKTHLSQVLLQTYWDARNNRYQSGSLYYWLCGPGADCWVHATLTCNGEMKLIVVGD
ncbi:hypothetical protein [Bdellovibrio sp. BCCA]|uniref:hypothetical protein n=1 Tax=Bdellovibrio sp. BCCA TaxID=3136281 RepID=UPI0030F10141